MNDSFGAYSRDFSSNLCQGHRVGKTITVTEKTADKSFWNESMATDQKFGHLNYPSHHTSYPWAIPEAGHRWDRKLPTCITGALRKENEQIAFK